MEEGCYISIGGRFCKRCKMMTRNETFLERLNDDLETVEGFCYLGNAFNASGDSEMIVIARTRIGWMRFREYREVLYGRFSLKMKGKVYRICARSTAILHGSETWCMR